MDYDSPASAIEQPPTTDEVTDDIITPPQPDRPERPRWHLLVLILAAVVIVGGGVVVTFLLTRQDSEPQQGADPDIITDDPIASRIAMSEAAKRYVGMDGSIFYDDMQALIAAAPDVETEKSLRRFFIFIALRHGFREGAFNLYVEYISTYPHLTDLEKCELYEYRHMIDSSYITNRDLYNPRTYEAEKVAACDAVLSTEEFTRHEDDTDYSYAHRLFYSGIIGPSIGFYESFYDYARDSEPEHHEARANITEYYYLNGDTDTASQYTIIE